LTVNITDISLPGSGKVRERLSVKKPDLLELHMGAFDFSKLKDVEVREQ
jgi:hypothetical protein